VCVYLLVAGARNPISLSRSSAQLSSKIRESIDELLIAR